VRAAGAGEFNRAGSPLQLFFIPQGPSGQFLSSCFFFLRVGYAPSNILKKKNLHASDISLYIKAFNHKVIPILSTVFSTIVGLIPFLIYGFALWHN
jgi:hypothetical protein